MAGTAQGAAKARAKRAADVQAPVRAVERDEAALRAADARLRARFGDDRRTLGEKPAHYVVTRRPLEWEGLTLLVGEEVPGAASWPRLEAWVRAGRIAPAYGGRMTTPEQPTVEAGLPEDLPENQATAAEDSFENPEDVTGEPLEDEPLEEVSK